MPINPEIPLQVKAIDLGDVGNGFLQGAQVGSNIKSQKLQNQLTQEQIAQQKFQTLNDREKNRITSTIYGAAELKPYLDSNDLEGAKNFLTRRRDQLGKRIASGENIDTAETDDALSLLDKDPTKLNQMAGHLVTLGQQTGILKTQRDLQGNAPSGITEYEYFDKLDPSEQNQYLNVKRQTAGQGAVVDSNGNVVSLNGYIPSQANLAGAKQSAKNTSDLAYSQSTSEAKARGQKIGAGEITDIQKKEQGQKQLSTVLNAARGSYARLNSQGGIINPENTAGQNILARVKNSEIGQGIQNAMGTPEQATRNEIKTQIPSIINSIRQATGMSAKAMDSNAELQFYLKMATDPKLDINTNFKALDTIENLYGKQSNSESQPSQIQQNPAQNSEQVLTSPGGVTYKIVQ